MNGYESVRDSLHSYGHLDAEQLFEHAVALRTEVHRKNRHSGLTPILFYVYAEPERWPANERPVDDRAKARHRKEIERFAAAVAGDEVVFVSCPYRRLLKAWTDSEDRRVRTHANAVVACFSP